MPMIPAVLERLSSVNRLLPRLAGQETITIDGACPLALFYRDYNDTALLVAEADRLAGNDMDGLYSFALSLSSECDSYLAADRTMLEATDFAGIFDSHIKPFKERSDMASQTATALWREYSAISNRLDFLSPESDEYTVLDTGCDAKHDAYVATHERAAELHALLRHEETRYLPVRYFRMMYLDVLVARLGEIARCIISDIDRIKAHQP